MIIDTHCHISYEYYDDIELVINDNLESGISKIVVSGCEKDNILEVLELKDKFKSIYVTLGYHPECADDISCEDLDFLKQKLNNNNKVVGLGEIGLDYYYRKDNRDKQIKLFEAQLKIAEELNLPVVIHSREATLDTINILKKYKIKGIIHCFSGSLETANIYISMGYKLGIGGVVTFKNSKLGEVIKNISLDDIVLETDSPYLAPEPFRGKQNSSKYLTYVVDYIANLKNVSYNDVVDITSKNAYSIFDFNDK